MNYPRAEMSNLEEEFDLIFSGISMSLPKAEAFFGSLPTTQLKFFIKKSKQTLEILEPEYQKKIQEIEVKTRWPLFILYHKIQALESGIEIMERRLKTDKSPSVIERLKTRISTLSNHQISVLHWDKTI